MGGLFDLPKLSNRLEALRNATLEPGFYDDIKKASEVNIEITTLEKKINLYNDLLGRIEADIELIELVEESEIKHLKATIDRLEI